MFRRKAFLHWYTGAKTAEMATQMKASPLAAPEDEGAA